VLLAELLEDVELLEDELEVLEDVDELELLELDVELELDELVDELEELELVPTASSTVKGISTVSPLAIVPLKRWLFSPKNTRTS
jgi:hypothetical protein